jgi:uncharacterized protein with GYD domain
MPKFLIEANYAADGLKGIIAQGGTARREAIEKMLADIGGTCESFHFGFGETDVFVIADVPDNVSAAAVAMQVGASGLARTKTTVLLTPEEIDRAADIKATYRAPGA